MLTPHAVAIHQPQYWPWPRYVHKILSAQTFVYLDTVQFAKNDVQNRNQIASNAGAMWLTVPVAQHLGQRILETPIADPRTPQRHLRSLQASYGRTPGWRRWRDELEALYAGPPSTLAELAVATTEWMLGKLGVTARRVRASTLDGIEGASSARVASICRRLAATDYLTGRGAVAYLRAEDFAGIGCHVRVQTWRAFTYPQAGGGPFVPDLSTLDLLLNCPDDAERLIREAGGWEPLW